MKWLFTYQEFGWRWLFVVFWLVVGGLLFFRLGATRAWQDEAEVVMLARRVREFGLPVTWDGNYLITQENGQDSRIIAGVPLWSWYTWGQYYPVALAFALFGESTFVARLPYALFGLLSLAMTYWIVRLVGRSRRFAFLTLVAMAFGESGQFFLYSRQTRYYTLTLLAVLGLVLGYVLVNRGNRWGTWLFLASGILGFHSTNFVTAGAALLGVWAHFWLLLFLKLRTRLRVAGVWLRSSLSLVGRQLVGASVVIVAQALVWFLFFRPAQEAGRLGFFRYWGGWGRVVEHSVNYWLFIDTFYLPVVFFFILVAVIFVFARVRSHGKVFQSIDSFWLLLAVLVVVQVVTIATFHQFGQRYLINLLPWMAVLLAWMIRVVYRQNFMAGAAFGLLLLGTNLLHQVSGRLTHPRLLSEPLTIRSYILDYISELSQPPVGPVDGAVHFLSQSANVGDMVVASYEQDALAFYLPRLRFGRRQAIIADHSLWLAELGYSEAATLDWLVQRRSWDMRVVLPDCVWELIQSHFEPTVLGVPDTQWQTMPDITYHRFQTDLEAPRLVIWRRVLPEAEWRRLVSVCF